MATRVVIERICDKCGDVAVDEDDVKSLLITVAKTEWEVDLCRACLIDSRIMEGARRVKKAPKAPPTLVDTVVARDVAPAAVPKKYKIQRGVFPCPDCDFVGKSPNALAGHSRKHK